MMEPTLPFLRLGPLCEKTVLIVYRSMLRPFRRGHDEGGGPLSSQRDMVKSVRAARRKDPEDLKKTVSRCPHCGSPWPAAEGTPEQEPCTKIDQQILICQPRIVSPLCEKPDHVTQHQDLE